jgi:hypothetical protein
LIIINTRRRILFFIALIAAVVFVCAAVSAAPDNEAKPGAAAEKKADDKDAEPQLSVEQKGSYVYWFTYVDADGVSQSTLPERFKGKTTEIDAEELGEKYSQAKICVMDKATGNLAIADFVSGKNIDLPADEFQYIRTVRLRVVAEDGKPIESAIVRISDGMSEKHSAVVTPADEGVATFANVATGEITVKVEAENLRKTINSDITISDKRDTPNFEQDIKVSGDVNTLAIEEDSPQAAPKKPDKKESSWVSILQAVSGLIMLVVAIAVIVIVLKAKGITGKSALKSFGVELPTEQTDYDAPATSSTPEVDPNVCQFCGQRKDASGNCACSVTPGSPPVSGTSAAAAGVPRLVGSQGVYAGHIFEIAGHSTVLGRDAENPVALVNDTTASRRHATILQADGGYSIRDEGSSNGTFVNGARITVQPLSAGDEIQIGGTKFRFEI